MKLTIEIPCTNGLDMEASLNKAIDDLSQALEKRGFSKMQLTAHNEDIESEPIYKVTIQ